MDFLNDMKKLKELKKKYLKIICKLEEHYDKVDENGGQIYNNKELEEFEYNLIEIQNEINNILFDHFMAPGLLGSFMPALYAETVQKGQSKLKGKVGEQIASSCLHLYNDPFVPGLSGSGFTDSEGVPIVVTAVTEST